MSLAVVPSQKVNSKHGAQNMAVTSSRLRLVPALTPSAAGPTCTFNSTSCTRRYRPRRGGRHGQWPHLRHRRSHPPSPALTQWRLPSTMIGLEVFAHFSLSHDYFTSSSWHLHGASRRGSAQAYPTPWGRNITRGQGPRQLQQHRR